MPIRIPRILSEPVKGSPIFVFHFMRWYPSWAGWLPRLIDRYRIVLWDMRGSGRSVQAGFDWSLGLLVSDVLAVADAAGVGRFHLVGESIGGTIALAADSRGRTDKVYVTFSKPVQLIGNYSIDNGASITAKA